MFNMLGGGFDKAVLEHRPFILESFYYADENTEKLIPYFGDFMLDSGAFTFMLDEDSKVDWYEYADKYADFIVRNKIKKYFELDRDYVVGYEEVKRLRRFLEDKTGVAPIPVFHKVRGLEEFNAMCQEYDYVAVGASGRHDSLWTRKHPEALKMLVRIAHKNKAKIHGLGFTNLNLLPQIHFDSVDSTAWTTGNRFGYVYKFDGRTMRKIDKPENTVLSDSRRVALINYCEWIKFQKYAEEHL